MTIAVGTKKKTAAITHKLIDDVPLCAAAAIHRGPSTVAMLKSRTSQNPISFRNWLMGLEAFAAWVTGLRPAPGLTRLASGNCAGRDRWSFQTPTRGRRRRLCRLAGRSLHP